MTSHENSAKQKECGGCCCCWCSIDIQALLHQAASGVQDLAGQVFLNEFRMTSYTATHFYLFFPI
jgi:hypothetical protein